MGEQEKWIYEEAKIAYDSGDNDRAFLLLTRLLEFEPTHSDGQELMVQVQKKREKPAAELRTALEYYETNPSERSAKKLGFTYKHLQRYNKAKHMFQRLLTERPDDHESQGALGKIYVNLEDYEEAIPLLEDSKLTRPGDSEVLYDLGLCYFKTGRFEESLEIFESMRISYSAEKGVRAWLGRSLEKLGNSEGALFYYKEELERFPWSPEGADFLSAYYREDSEIELSNQVIENAEQAVKNRPAEIMSMAVMFTRTGRYERGRALFRHAIDIGAERGYGLSLLYSNMGVAYLGLNDRDKAEECFNRSLEVYNGCHNAVHNKGLADFYNGKYETSIGYLQQALEMEPERDITLSLLGEVYFASGDTEKGKEYYEAAIKRKPHSPYMYMRYARELHNADMDKEAQKMAFEALRVRPGYQDAFVLLARIKANDLDLKMARVYLDMVTDNKYKTGEYWNVANMLFSLAAGSDRTKVIKMKDVHAGKLNTDDIFIAEIPKPKHPGASLLGSLLGLINGELARRSKIDVYFSLEGQDLALPKHAHDILFMHDAGAVNRKCTVIIRASDSNDKKALESVERIKISYEKISK